MNQNTSFFSLEFFKANLGDIKDVSLIFLVSVPLSVLIYIIFSRYRHWMEVDLVDHTWLVK
jgi:hypothetical protein